MPIPNLLQICHHADGSCDPHAPKPSLLFPGSFNPLHVGHLRLAEAAHEHYGSPVHFELSIANVDKPTLPDHVVLQRVQQFIGVAPIWITHAPLFVTKAEMFPGTRFVVGFDTATRLLDPMYAGSEQKRDADLRQLLEVGCRFAVAGRVDAKGRFREWSEQLQQLPIPFHDLFDVIPEAEFRMDISSTQLRQAGT